MNWVNAMPRYRAATPSKVLPPMLNALKPGQQLLFIRPLTEGVANWKAPWTQRSGDARRNGARSSATTSSSVGGVAPHNYRGSCCIADSAILYKKV